MQPLLQQKKTIYYTCVHPKIKGRKKNCHVKISFFGQKFSNNIFLNALAQSLHSSASVTSSTKRRHLLCRNLFNPCPSSPIRCNLFNLYPSPPLPISLLFLLSFSLSHVVLSHSFPQLHGSNWVWNLQFSLFLCFDSIVNQLQFHCLCFYQISNQSGEFIH